MKFVMKSWYIIVAGLIILAFVLIKYFPRSSPQPMLAPAGKVPVVTVAWQPPDINKLPDSDTARLIRYGKELIANTARYLGPKGSVAAISNGMNCQNCHIDAGLKPFSNCFSAVAATYPVYRPRSGRLESIEFRVNDCMQRSMNGHPLDSLSREMRAMVSFLKWVGKDVHKGEKPVGAGVVELPFLERAADTATGRSLYLTKCMSCHGKNGQGLLYPDSASYIYPPLWGPNSYNTGAGLYRLTRFAGYIKSSMPFGATHQNPLLTDAECWDIAAFVNSQPRPLKLFKEDWPILSLKSIDYPFGPYTDSFSERQHKLGPFGPIKKAREQTK
jgi:thiosulfate dehydrogenase